MVSFSYPHRVKTSQQTVYQINLLNFDCLKSMPHLYVLMWTIFQGRMYIQGGVGTRYKIEYKVDYLWILKIGKEEFILVFT